MKKLAEFLINRRRVLTAVMLALTAVCAVLALRVPINRDRTKYLADSSEMKQGLSIMEDVFPESDETASIRVMFDDLTADQIPEIKAQLEAIPNVSGVAYEAGSEEYNKDNHTLFVVNSRYDYDTDEEHAIEAAIEEGFPGYTMAYENNDVPATELPLWVVVLALTLAVIILLVMSDSWLDPVLFLVTIGVAVVLNMGTNILFPYVDEMTATVGPILQLVLSMDYSIILMNRYRQEKVTHSDKVSAMKTALAGSVSSIASSSLTTVVGLLALVFLSFKLGPELGIVLAKGVFISMLCAFTVLPAMILAMDPLLEKTRKKSPHVPMARFSRLSYKTRYAMPAVFAALFIASFILQGYTQIVFTEENDDPLANVFPKKNTVAVVYRNEDEAKIDSVISELEKDERVSDILGYANTLGKEMTAEDMGKAVAELSDDAEPIGDNLLRMLYFIAEDGKMPVITASDFINFITDTVLPDKTIGKHLDAALRDNAEQFRTLADRTRLTTAISVDEMAELFGIDRARVEKLYLYYTIQNGVADSGTMTLPVFVDYVLNSVAANETYGSMVSASAIASLRQLQTYTNTNTVLAARSAADLAALIGADESTVNTVFILDNAGDVSAQTMSLPEFSSFLCGSLLQDALFSSYFDDAAKAQAQTMDALVQLAVSGQGLTPDQMAQTLGMDAESVSKLYSLYFSADPAFQKEAAAMTMTLTDFLPLLKANAPAEQQAQLAQTEQLVNLAVSGQALDAETMAGVTGMTTENVAGLYLMSGTEAMTLPDFLSAALTQAPDNAGLQQMNQLVQLAVSGQALDASSLASVFGMDTAQVCQIFALVLAGQKTVALADFSAFLVNSVLTNAAYAGAFSEEQAAQLRRLDSIAQLAVSGTPLDAGTLAQLFGTDTDTITMAFRLYFGRDISQKTMSLKAFTDFALSDPLVSGMMDASTLDRIQFLQAILNAAINGTAFTSARLASFLGMDPAQTEQLYILRMGENGGTDSWTISPRSFVAFAATDVLGDAELAKQIDEKTAEELRQGHTLIEAVVSEKAYTASEMTALLSSLTDEVTENETEILYLLYGGVNDADPTEKMTIVELFDLLCDKMMNDGRFAEYFDGETKKEILDSKAELEDAVAQMRGKAYARMVVTSDYPDESPETSDYVTRLDTLCRENLSEYYLVGNSVMVSEMDRAFDSEYRMISLITAISVFLVVLIAFRHPILPLILTLLVQCGVFITVTVIGAYSGSIYYLALLIVQSILMGATIDYGIVFCNFYMDSRKTMDVTDALRAAYEGSIHTIMTSGSILVLVLAALGILVSSPMISDVSTTLSIGALVAMLLILLVLPGMTVCCDRLINRKKTEEKTKTP